MSNTDPEDRKKDIVPIPPSQNHTLTKFRPAPLYREVDGSGVNLRAKMQVEHKPLHPPLGQM